MEIKDVVKFLQQRHNILEAATNPSATDERLVVEYKARMFEVDYIYTLIKDALMNEVLKENGFKG